MASRTRRMSSVKLASATSILSITRATRLTGPGPRRLLNMSYRWIVERTLSWLMRNRRLSKDYERKVQTSETFIEVAMIHLILRRLEREV